MTAPDRARLRTVERHQAAALRAVGGDPTAELRGTRLTSRDRVVDIASPYRTLSEETELPLAAARGAADGLGLLLRHSDLELHRELRPSGALERVVYDLLEQVRCEATAPPLPGVRSNLDAAFTTWCFGVRSDRIAERGLALLLYTVTHMVRARLVRALPDEEVDGIIEATRANISPIIGETMAELVKSVDDQAAYARSAAELAALIGEIAGDVGDARRDGLDDRHRLLVPADWAEVDDALDGEPMTGLTATATAGELDGPLTELGGYHAYTQDYDAEVTGAALYPEPLRLAARAGLDRQSAAQAVSPHRLAERLRRLFGATRSDDWTFDQEDGVLDGRRLVQLVANPDDHHVFRQRREIVRSDTAVTFLLDNSGSMKLQRFEALAVLVDTLARALDIAGVTTEVLGFTTGGWNGGRTMVDWRRDGSPADPGRLNETLHIVYKDAETSWRRARSSLASMMRPLHFREGVDGEAIAWAHRRLIGRPEPRKVLVVVSDGAPMDAATANTNPDGFLADHLRAVVDHIERRSPVELGALAVDQDVSAVFRHSTPIDLDGTLTIGTYGALELLFGARMGR